MHDLLDDYAQNNNLRNVSPKLKLILGMGSILICVFSPTLVAPILVGLIMSMTTVFLARIPARFYCKLLFVPLTFALFSCLAILFVRGFGDKIVTFQIFSLSFGIEREGLSTALLILFRTMGGACSLFFIALTTPMIEIFSILKYLHIPDVLLELSMLIYRYIFVLMDMAIRISSAQTIRLGHNSLMSSIKSFSMLSSVLFIRAWEQGERLAVAMDARCYDGRLNTMEKHVPIKLQSIAIVFVYLVIVAIIAFLTRDIRMI